MKYYARNLEIKQVSNSDADLFIQEHHDQGLVKFGGNRYNLGLYDDDTLLGLVCFSNPRTVRKAKEYQHELVRMVFPRDVQVVGGASKLIHHYIERVCPRNFFTYQTMGGQQSDVYAHAGMTLIKTEKEKKILVKNGYTYKEALEVFSKTGEKYLYINAQLSNLGPDKLLGTELGTRYENGKRLTNKELFIRYCDYHEEIVPGDRVYEYNNPNYTHYIYRISNSNPEDPRYYLGRHSVYSESKLTVDDLLIDGYMGSGGVYFRNWKRASKERGYDLVKEILSIQVDYKDNLKAELEVIGDKYKTDPNCLNRTIGGSGSSSIKGEMSIGLRECPIHGNVMHHGESCCVCKNNNSVTKKECSVHGLVTHQGDSCCRCTIENKYAMKECSVHGLTKHQGNSCCLCDVRKHYSTRYCDVCQRETSFHGKRCMACVNREMHTERECPIHGVTKHRGESCMKCVQAKRVRPPKKEKVVERKHCSVCDKTARHVNGACMSCQEHKLYRELECDVHGLTKHRGRTCCKCRAERVKAKREFAKKGKK